MIPQRNLSLLANRLAKEGGRRIPESVLERDYCLAWFLAALAETDLKAVLGFKGGTALKRCYFSDYRFSEDLDFTLTAQATQDENQGPAGAGKPRCATHQASSSVLTAKTTRGTRTATISIFVTRGRCQKAMTPRWTSRCVRNSSNALPERTVLRGYDEFTDLPENRRLQV
jgi:hypothetical protein